MARAKLNEHGVTEQQEKFCRAFVETGNASESYRQAYKAEKMTANSIGREASLLLKNPKITQRLNQLRQVHQQRHAITVDTLLEKLNNVYDVAMDTGTDGSKTAQAAAATGAIMAQAKLLGLDKQLVELTGTVNVSITPEDVKAFRKAFDKDF